MSIFSNSTAKDRPLLCCLHNKTRLGVAQLVLLGWVDLFALLFGRYCRQDP